MFRRFLDLLCRGRALPTWLLLLGGAFTLVACGSHPDQREPSAAPPLEPAAAGTVTTRDPAETLPPQAIEQFEQALALVDAGNLAAAEQTFEALARTYPTYAGPLVNLGILQANAGKLEAAEQTLQAALQRNADHAVAYNQLGIVYRRQGRFQEAEQAYTRAVQIDPSYANAHLNLGVLCDLYLQQPQRALQAYQRYLSLASTPDEKVGRWVKELELRLRVQDAAGAGS